MNVNRVVGVVGLVVLACRPVQAQQAVVEQVKAELQAKGVDLAGPCGAYAITARVIWVLRAQGAGALSKPSGNNCEGRATDYLVFRQGPSYDLLGDGGGANTPQWAEDDDPALLARWVAPVDPGDSPGPGQVPTPDTVLVRLDALAATLADLLARIDALKTQGMTTQQEIEAVHHRIDEVVMNAERSAAAILPLLLLRKP